MSGIHSGLIGSFAASLAGYNSIATVSYPSGSGGTASFTSIPTGYRHLQIRAFTRDTASGTTAQWTLRFNGDTATNYNYAGMFHTGTGSITGDLANNQSQIVSDHPGSSTTPFGVTIIDIFDVNQTNKFKAVNFSSGFSNAGSTARLFTMSGTWRSTSAISSITFAPQTAFAQYSHIALYGIV
jgi:hypothetical protein